MDWGIAVDSNIWRTLSSEEWKYLLNTRKVNGGTEYGKTCVWATIKVDEDVNVGGLIIFCDDYNGSTDDLDSIPDGCVFLPAAGRREINSSTDPETATKYGEGYLCYWSATPATGSHAHNFVFEPYGCGIGTSTRNFGYAVRLVTDCE